MRKVWIVVILFVLVLLPLPAMTLSSQSWLGVNISNVQARVSFSYYFFTCGTVYVTQQSSLGSSQTVNRIMFICAPLNMTIQGFSG